MQRFTFFLLLLLSACATSKPANFFLLSPIAERGTITEGVKIGVGPVRLPTYLERPQMVTRPNDAELTIDEFNRWGEPLEETITTVIAINLARMLGTFHVELYPFKGNDRVDYQVKFDFIRFEYLEESKSIEIYTRWLVTGAREREILAQDVFLKSLPASEVRTVQVRAMNTLLAELSSTVAKGIKSLPQ